ncbi:hypothetical protein Ddc_23187 [Ditylenchus destructor]|nr:hypothetical protein Ddc_23187 [Ditylenchus destructor]
MAFSKVVIIAFLVIASVLIGEAAKRHRNMAASTTCSNGSTQSIIRTLVACDTDSCQTCASLCTACTQTGRTCSGCTCDQDNCDLCTCDCS